MKDYSEHNENEQKEEEYEEPSLEDFLAEEEETEEDKAQRLKKKRWIRLGVFIIAGLLLLQGVSSLFAYFSRDVIELSRTSEQVIQEEDVEAYMAAVVTIQGQGNRGTGFAITSDGYLLTNHHVIKNRQPLAVTFPNGDIYQAEVVDAVEEVDVALLKVEGEQLPFLSLREHSAVAEEEIFVIGNPLTQTQIVNRGEIIENQSAYQTMRISNSIFPGHSGSPVLSADGEVVGVVYARSVPGLWSGEERYGLAIPVEEVFNALPGLEEILF